MAEMKFKLTNAKARFFINKNGQVTKDNGIDIPTEPVLTIDVRPSTSDEFDQVKVCFPPSVKVEGIKLSDDKSKVVQGQQAYHTEQLLKTLWIEELDGVEYVEGDDCVYIDCVLAKDEKDVDPDAVPAVIKEFKAGRKAHNDKCPAEPPKPADDSSKKSGDDSDGDKSKKSGDSDGDKSKDKPKDKPQDKPKPKKRQPRKADESATGATLEHITQAQADLDTHATLVAIGGEDFAKHFNGLVWDEASQTYKDET